MALIQSWGWPQFLIAALYGLLWARHVWSHGEPMSKPTHYHWAGATTVYGLMIFVLYSGGFFTP